MTVGHTRVAHRSRDRAVSLNDGTGGLEAGTAMTHREDTGDRGSAVSLARGAGRTARLAAGLATGTARSGREAVGLATGTGETERVKVGTTRVAVGLAGGTAR